MANNPSQIPWQNETAANRNAYSLLDIFLAMGFAPQETSGEGLLCGANALAISLRAQQELTANGLPILPQHTWTPTRIASLINSERYNAIVAERMAPLAGGRARRAKKMAVDAGFFDENNFNVEQLRIFLQIINEDLGTRYSLGRITFGYQLPKRAGVPSNVFIDDVGQGTRGGTVWLVHQHLEVEEGELEEGEDPPGHWEGFSPNRLMTSEMRAELRYLLDHSTHRNLRTAINKKSLSIVTDDYDPDVINALEVYKGCVLYPTPEGKKKLTQNSVANAFIHMSTGQGGATGLVHSDKLRDLVTLNNADSSYKDIAQEGGDSPSNANDMKFEVFRVLHETSKVCEPHDELRIQEISDDIPQGEQVPVTFHLDLQAYGRKSACYTRDMQGNEGYVHNRILQKIMFAPWGQETLPLTETAPADNEIEAVEPKFDKTVNMDKYLKHKKDRLIEMCQTRKLQVKATHGKRVKNGVKELVKADYIDALLAKDETEANEKAKVNTITSRAKAVNKKNAGDKKRGFLPMYRVLEQIDLTDDDDEALRFYENEIVLRVGDGAITLKEKKVSTDRDLVIDYEGRFARIPRDIMQPIDKPWNLEIDLEKFQGELDILNKISRERQVNKALKRKRDDEDDEDDRKGKKVKKTSSNASQETEKESSNDDDESIVDIPEDSGSDDEIVMPS